MLIAEKNAFVVLQREILKSHRLHRIERTELIVMVIYSNSLFKMLLTNLSTKVA